LNRLSPGPAPSPVSPWNASEKVYRQVDVRTSLIPEED
jgi:hypothetical protein